MVTVGGEADTLKFLELFFMPQWKSADPNVALEGVKAVDDDETLRRVVQESLSPQARVAAMEKINDQAYYREIATTSKDARLVEEAAKHIDDFDVLEVIRARHVAGYRKIENIIEGLKRRELDAVLAEIPTMDDTTRLIEIATSNPKDDWFKPVSSNRDYPSYKPPRTIEDDLREAAVRRLAEFGDDKALAEVIRRGYDRTILDRAASTIRDTRVLDRLVLDGSFTSWPVVDCVVAHMDNIELLRKLSAEVDPTTILPAAAMRRLCELPCLDVRGHDWELIYEDEDDPYADRRITSREYRCARCGIIRETRSST